MDITEEIQFDLTKNTKLLTVEELETALLEEQRISDQLLREAEARAKHLKQALEVAKKEKRKQELHKITTILKNLKEEFGDDFLEVAQKMIKPKIIVLNDAQQEEYKRYQHIHGRGYKVVGKDIVSFGGNIITSNIPSQTGFVPKFTMGLNTYRKLYNKYNG